MLPLILLLAEAQASASRPSCSITDRPSATRLSALPPAVRKAIGNRIADSGAPFHTTDMVFSGQESWPFMRLICGYPVPRGYVVEREQGGRGCNIGKIMFRKTSSGYEREN